MSTADCWRPICSRAPSLEVTGPTEVATVGHGGKTTPDRRWHSSSSRSCAPSLCATAFAARGRM
jgi:hypothetical protein